MAAGLGSRFGGVKQLARVGSGGEAIIDFSIKDGLAAGFGDVIMIVRSEIEDDVRAHIAEQHGPDLPVTYVRQDDLPPPREKPWGTLHAVLSAAKAITGPFAVINADDYYGPSTYEIGYGSVTALGAGEATNIVFEISKTVPPSGAVTRGVVEVADGKLTRIVETTGCERHPDGTYWAGGVQVGADAPVSMNFWCFHPSVLEGFQQRWDVFYEVNADDPKAEAMLPTVVDELMGQDKLQVGVLTSPEQWIGITNPDDLELVREALGGR